MYRVVSEALLANQHSERMLSPYEPFIKTLQHEKDLSIKVFVIFLLICLKILTVAIQEQTLVILGCLIEYSGGLEANFAIECELHKLGIGDIFNVCIGLQLLFIYSNYNISS